MRKLFFIIALLFLSAPVAAENIIEDKFENCDFIIYNQCIHCDNPFAFEVGFEENCTNVCPNRTTNIHGSGSLRKQINCALKKCPQELPYRDKDGSCYKDEKHVPRWDNEYTGFYSMFATDNKHYPQGFPAENEQCPDNTPLYKGGKCYSCYEIDTLNISKEECNKCPNREYIYSKEWEHGGCSLSCPADTPLKRYDGKCFSCEEKKVVATETWCNFDVNCEVCSNRTIIHDLGGNVPSIPNCPPDKPLMDSHGVCYSCDTEEYVDVTYNENFCHRFCPDKRHIIHPHICIWNK